MIAQPTAGDTRLDHPGIDFIWSMRPSVAQIAAH
jgi:hypothetical protein